MIEFAITIGVFFVKTCIFFFFLGMFFLFLIGLVITGFHIVETLYEYLENDKPLKFWWNRK